MTPIDPEMCSTTGRILTEWFETPELTEDQLWELAFKETGVDPEDVNVNKRAADYTDLERKVTSFVSARKRRKWGVSGMTREEVAVRLNDATKMIDPENYKFLDDETRERTGLEINPLWMMECIVRAGVLSPKEQVAALKELAAFTHSKAPSVNKNMNVNGSPEEWLELLGQEEYKTLDQAGVMRQPKQPVEFGYGKQAEKNATTRIKDTKQLAEHNEARLEDMMQEVDLEEVDWEEINIHDL